VPAELEEGELRELVHLMALCWSGDSAQRPPLSTIIATMDELGGTRSAKALSYAAGTCLSSCNASWMHA